MRRSLSSGSGKRSGQRFDATHGITTEALIFLGELDPEAIGDALEDATHYEPTPIAQFDELLHASGVPPGGRTFIDIGAGMGRIVLLASLRPFKQIAGVEVSPALCETARDNVVRWLRKRTDVQCRDIRIVHRDASAFRFPPGDLVVYLYNPFGESTLQRFAERLAREAAGNVCVLYHTPVHRAVFDEHSAFELVKDLGFGRVYKLRPSIPQGASIPQHD